MSSYRKDCGQTRSGLIPAALNSSIICCAYLAWVKSLPGGKGMGTSGVFSSGVNWRPRPSTIAMYSRSDSTELHLREYRSVLYLAVPSRYSAGVVALGLDPSILAQRVL